MNVQSKHLLNRIFAGVRFQQAIATAAVFFMTAASSNATDDTDTYAKWVKSWAERPMTSSALGGCELKTIVSVITGESDPETVSGLSQVARLKLSYRIKVAATEVAVNGKYRNYFVSNTETKAAGARVYPPEKMRQMDELLNQLPEDHAQLPPAGCRVVVQTLEKGAWRVRVYDGTHLPVAVKSLWDHLANSYASPL